MQWEQGRRSANVEDRRGTRIGRGGIAIGGGGLLVVLLVLLLGGDPSQILGALSAGGGHETTEVPVHGTPEEERLVDFVSAVLGSTEEVWHEQFRRIGRSYEEPRLVLFRDAVESACGLGASAVGPFYCPGDRQVYLDLAFFEDLERELGAAGDFAQAYVIAHEVGHHVQNLLGTMDEVARARSSGARDANELSVRLELQADFLAGVWAHHANRRRPILEEGDV
jgi:predicted metalloprotease